MSRVVTLIASATEMVYALGEGHRLVGRSHECDWPAAVKALPVLTAPKLKIEMEIDPRTGIGHEPTSAEIDAQVRALVSEALAVYRVDAAALDAVRPDLIITQTQCEVCAVSLKDVEAAVCQLIGSRPKIVALEPNSLDDIFRDLHLVAAALGVPDRGLDVERAMRGRMAAVQTRAQGTSAIARDRASRASSGSSRSCPRATGCLRSSRWRVACRSLARQASTARTCSSRSSSSATPT